MPDLAYFTDQQIRGARKGEQQMPVFGVEILSDSESFTDVAEKEQDYFDAGVQLIWYSAPRQQKIYAYTSPDDIKVYKGDDQIIAEPVLADFQLVVADLFRE